MYIVHRPARGQQVCSSNNLITRSAKIRCLTIPLEDGAQTEGKVAVNIDNAQYLSVEKFAFIEVPEVIRVFPMDTVRE